MKLLTFNNLKKGEREECYKHSDLLTDIMHTSCFQYYMTLKNIARLPALPFSQGKKLYTFLDQLQSSPGQLSSTSQYAESYPV